MTDVHTRRIMTIVGPSIEAMGYELVRVMMTGGDRPTLQIMAERADRGPMTVGNCAELSRTISAVLDVEDPISSEYTLEVSSPGIDRPLMRLEDYRRFAGFDARIDVDPAIEGRKRFNGRLAGVDGENRVLVEIDPGTTAPLPFEAIARAKLVLTDALLKASREGTR